MQKRKHALGMYLVICIVGLTAGTIFWLFVALRLIKIEGYWKTWLEIYRGNHVIISNHPSMRDPFLFILMWWPWALIMPHKFFIWNFPGKNYFTDFMVTYFGDKGWSFPEWIYPMIHAIPVERDGSNKRDVIRESQNVLSSKGTLVVFGETRRTGSKPRQENAPDIEFVYNDDDTRKMQTVSAALIKTSATAGASFSTAWVDMPFWEEDPDFGLLTWLRGWHTVTITFSDSFMPDKAMKAAPMNKDVEIKILHTKKGATTWRPFASYFVKNTYDTRHEKRYQLCIFWR